MISGKVTGFNSIERNLIAMANRFPDVAIQAAHNGATVVQRYAKTEGFRTVGEVIGERTVTRGVHAGKKVKVHAALGKPIPGKLTSRTGALRSSIQVVDMPERSAARVGPSTGYGAIHEFGGTITIGARSWVGGFVADRKRSKPNKSTRLRGYRARHSIGGGVINMPARPYMRPALHNHMPEVRRVIVQTLIKGLALKPS